MAKLKKGRVRAYICETCHGNGYIKVEQNVHQCWDCDSEGEFYEEVTDNLIDDGPSDTLH